MAHMTPITVPVMNAAGLKCCPCTDKAITDGHGPDDVVIPFAVTMAPTMQTFKVQGQEVAAPATIPVCYDCRKRQIGVVSKTGLAVV